ncbi:MAG: tRNA (guanosine(18)-2'-O)-methyltransferase TrmH [candidate division Zixibacteria bacterium]|nr:tRNA (guanosine(18)-2'-O)-methyltransferase TrmH [candidate division Zixibacteria bacterium]
MQPGKRFEKIKWVLDRRQPDLTVVMDGVKKPHNVAAVIRTCDAVGISEIHTVTVQHGLRFRNHAASGTHKWIDVIRHHDVASTVAVLRMRGFHLLAAHHEPTARDFRTVDYTKPTAIVVGTELEGLSPETVALCDEMLRIPMSGMVESLNVSVATALILFEAHRQRTEAGFYETRRLDDETYTHRLFEFTHPQVSAYCRRKQLPYPAMNERGEIAEPFSAPSILQTPAS